MDETIYYLLAGGGYASVTVTGDAEYDPPPGATVISQAAYELGVAQVEAANAAYVAGLREAEQQAAQDDYEALVAAGIPEATALRLSGHVPGGLLGGIVP